MKSTAQSTSNVTEKLSEELQLCKEKVSSLEDQNDQLELQGSKVIKLINSNYLIAESK